MLRQPFIYLVIVLDTIVSAILALIFGIVNPYSRTTSGLIRLWARIILMAAGIKVEVSGKENLQPQQSYVLVANHQSYMDIPVLAGSLPLGLRIIAKKELFRIPLFGWGMRGAGMLKIDRSHRKKAMETLREAELILRKYHLSILAFPEGTRSPDGQIHLFKKGPFILAINTGLPVLPVSATGTHSINPKGKLTIKPGKVRLIIHPPIPTAEMELAERNELVARTQKIITEGFLENDEEIFQPDHH
ncbi:MAG: lysophospholipid acyltransferase family protein [Calditrichia bacterium]